MWCPECGPEGWCDFEDNVQCRDRPICDANDDNCRIQPTVPPTPCDRYVLDYSGSQTLNNGEQDKFENIKY